VIIWDTGPLFAAADVDDRDHSRCVELMRRTPAPLLMPVPVLTEVGYLLEREKGARTEAEFLRSIRMGQVVIVPLTAADLDRMVELVEAYGDFPLGLVDASVVAVAERLNADAIATLDRRHFSVVRPRHLPAFKLLPEASD
jgi:predicted nucleic acid-binding protein